MKITRQPERSGVVLSYLDDGHVDDSDARKIDYKELLADMQSLLRLADFNDGHRYDEFNGRTDRLAAYGVGALVAGGVAAKMGLLATLFALTLAFKKILVVAVLAVGGFFPKWFKGRSKEQPVG